MRVLFHLHFQLFAQCYQYIHVFFFFYILLFIIIFSFFGGEGDAFYEHPATSSIGSSTDCVSTSHDSVFQCQWDQAVPSTQLLACFLTPTVLHTSVLTKKVPVAIVTACLSTSSVLWTISLSCSFLLSPCCEWCTCRLVVIISLVIFKVQIEIAFFMDRLRIPALGHNGYSWMCLETTPVINVKDKTQLFFQ